MTTIYFFIHLFISDSALQILYLVSPGWSSHEAYYCYQGAIMLNYGDKYLTFLYMVSPGRYRWPIIFTIKEIMGYETHSDGTQTGEYTHISW